ncbi:MAG TPA: serine/threonine-protein kinase [Terriglobales bacterium]|nr:serine/threonine-protein kinase [Terriglobales bacterium]
MATPGPAIGEVIGDYRVLRKLGEGGMGVVYLAEDTRLGRRVALKALARDYAGDLERRRRFLNEARAAAAFNHANVAAVYELEERGDDVFIIFEFVEGHTLRALVETGGAALEQLLGIAVQVAAALEAAHAKGIVHRDLKPENVMLSSSGDVKVLDFGLARFDSGVLGGMSATQSFGLTQAGTVMGTVGYMSPEQLEGRPTDFRSDIFSFGVLMYELAAGTHPFAGATPASTIANVMTQEPPPLTATGALHPAELERIVRKCLRKSRDERYQSTRELLVDLKNLKRDSGSSQVLTAPLRATPEDESSLFRAVAARAGVTPRRWWELHQLFVVFLYTPLALWLAFQGSTSLSAALNTGLAGNWHGWGKLTEAVASGKGTAIWMAAGLPLYIGLTFFLVIAAVLRLYSIVLAMFLPARLQEDVVKMRAALRPIESFAGMMLAFVGFLLLRTGSGIVLGSILAALGAMALFAVVTVEPVMFHAAFPQVEQPRRDPAAAKARILAGLQAMFALVYAGLGIAASHMLQESLTGALRMPNPQATTTAVVVVVMTGFFLCAASAVGLLTRPAEKARTFRRFFPAFAAANILAGIALGAATVPLLNSFLLLFIVAIAVVPVTFYERRLARELAPPEPHAPSDFSSRRDQAWWLLHQLANLLVLAPWVGYWGSLTRGYYPPFGKLAFFLLVLLVGARWSLHFVLMCVWTGHRPGVAATWRRVSGPLRYTGFGIVATMLTEAAMAAANDQLVFGSLLGALAMGGLVSVLYIEPLLIPPGMPAEDAAGTSRV